MNFFDLYNSFRFLTKKFNPFITFAQRIYIIMY